MSVPWVFLVFFSRGVLLNPKGLRTSFFYKKFALKSFQRNHQSRSKLALCLFVCPSICNQGVLYLDPVVVISRFLAVLKKHGTSSWISENNSLSTCKNIPLSTNKRSINVEHPYPSQLRNKAGNKKSCSATKKFEMMHNVVQFHTVQLDLSNQGTSYDRVVISKFKVKPITLYEMQSFLGQKFLLKNAC